MLGLPAWAAPVVTMRFTFAPPAGRGDGIYDRGRGNGLECSCGPGTLQGRMWIEQNMGCVGRARVVSQ